jgi:hypothetical protein
MIFLFVQLFSRTTVSLPPSLSPPPLCSHAYATKSNVQRKLRTPGGKLGVQTVKKKTKGPQTPSGDNGRIHGVSEISSRGK